MRRRRRWRWWGGGVGGGFGGGAGFGGGGFGGGLFPGFNDSTTEGFNPGYFVRGSFTDWFSPLIPAAPAHQNAKTDKRRRGPQRRRRCPSRSCAPDALRALEGGLKIEAMTESFDDRWSRKLEQSSTLWLYSPSAWLTQTQTPGSQTLVDYYADAQRGRWSRAFKLGRRRQAEPGDGGPPSLPFSDHSLIPLHQSYRDSQAAVEDAGENRMRLILSHPNSASRVIALLDTQRHCLLEWRRELDGKVGSRTVFSEFVRVAGSYWPTRVENFDGADRQTSLVTLSINPLSQDAFQETWDETWGPEESLLILTEPMPSVLMAKVSLQRGLATSEDRLALATHFYRTQQWDRVFEQLDGLKELGPEPTGRLVDQD